MPLYKLTKEAIVPIGSIRFADAGLKERGDLQRVLREKIDVICPDTLIVAEEFGQWEESRRRIDLLGIDQEANLVVIELKRSEDGGHMELQALRYAAMISALTFERVVEVFGEYLLRFGSQRDPRAVILDHLGWESPEDGEFATLVRLVLASADFSKELTTAVLWLNEQGLDIRCVRLTPYRLDEAMLVNVEQVIPLPEASEYTVSIRAKRQEARARKDYERDFTKFVLTLDGRTLEPLNKRRSILEAVRYLVSKGATPEGIQPILGQQRRRHFRCVEGMCTGSEAVDRLIRTSQDGETFDPGRYFREDDEMIHHNGRTYLVPNQWGGQTQQTLEALAAKFPQHRIEIKIAG